MLLKPASKDPGPLARLFGAFNRGFDKATRGYVTVSRLFIRRAFLGVIALVAVSAGAFWLFRHVPTGFLPGEDQGVMVVNVQLPNAASLDRTDAVVKQIEALLAQRKEVTYVSGVVGYSMLTGTTSSDAATIFVSFADWAERPAPEQRRLRHHPVGQPRAGADRRRAGLRLPDPADQRALGFGRLHHAAAGPRGQHAAGTRGPAQGLPRRAAPAARGGAAFLVVLGLAAAGRDRGRHGADLEAGAAGQPRVPVAADLPRRPLRQPVHALRALVEGLPAGRWRVPAHDAGPRQLLRARQHTAR